MSTVNPGMPPAAAGVAPVAPVAGGPTGPVTPTSGAPTSFNAKPQRKIPLTYLIGALVLVLVVVGGGAAFFLSQTSQDLRQQAATSNPYTGACGSTGQNGCFNGTRYVCIGGTWQNGGSCGTPTPSATPTPTPSQGGSCGDAGKTAVTTLTCYKP